MEEWQGNQFLVYSSVHDSEWGGKKHGFSLLAVAYEKRLLMTFHMKSNNFKHLKSLQTLQYMLT